MILLVLPESFSSNSASLGHQAWFHAMMSRDGGAAGAGKAALRGSPVPREGSAIAAAWVGLINPYMGLINTWVGLIHPGGGY